MRKKAVITIITIISIMLILTSCSNNNSENTNNYPLINIRYLNTPETTFDNNAILLQDKDTVVIILKLDNTYIRVEDDKQISGYTLKLDYDININDLEINGNITLDDIKYTINEIAYAPMLVLMKNNIFYYQFIV